MLSDKDGTKFKFSGYGDGTFQMIGRVGNPHQHGRQGLTMWRQLAGQTWLKLGSSKAPQVPRPG